MEQERAKGLVALLIAAFPSARDYPRSTVDLYVLEVAELRCEVCALEAVHTVIRTSQFFPAVADLLAEYRDEFRLNHASHGEAALPEEATWTPEMVAEAQARGVEILARYRQEHPRPDSPEPPEPDPLKDPLEDPLEDIVAKPIETDEAEVAHKRARARQLSDRINDALGVGL